MRRWWIAWLVAAGACSRAPAATGNTSTPAVAPAPASSIRTDRKLEELVSAEAGRVLSASGALGLSKRTRAVVGSGPVDAATWTIEIDAALASPFSLGPACSPDGATDRPISLCHADGDRTVCSREGLEALLRLAAGQTVPACDGSGTGPGTESVDYRGIDGTPAMLLLVLAHELAHIELGHEAVGERLPPRARGPAGERLRALRDAATGAPAQVAIERAADEFAGQIVNWLLQRAAESNGEHADYVITHHTLAMRAALLCLDMASTCRWSDEPKLPPETADIEEQATRLACMALRAPEGAILPTLRGTHGDWAARMTVVHALSASTSDPVPGEPGLSSLVQAVSQIFVFWEQHGEAYTKALALRVRQLTHDFDPASCARFNAP